MRVLPRRPLPSNAPGRFSVMLGAILAVVTTPCDFAKADPSRCAVEGQKTLSRTASSCASASRAIVLALDSTHAPSTSCDLAKKHDCEGLVQDNILWRIDAPDDPASKHWLQKNLDDLCGCTADPYATVNCFQIEVNNHHKTWREAVSTCRAKP